MAWNVGPSDQALAELLDPVHVDDFFANTWAQHPLVINGEAPKFTGLMTWDDVDRIIESDIVSSPRFTMSHRGAFLPKERFLRAGDNNAEDGVNGAGVQSCLAQGATMTVNAVDRLVPAVSQMASALEETFGTAVFANLYLAFGKDNGFGVHRDLQDVVIAQVEGRKRWAVYEPTREHPRKGDEGKPPAHDPYWEGVLEQGQALYLPRGWWHVASAVDEPSLHLTITIVPPTGEDYLKWLVDKRADGDSAVRANLPVLGRDSSSVAIDSFTNLGDASGPELQEFLEYWKSQVRARTRLGLAAGWRPQAMDLHPGSRFLMGLTRGFGRVDVSDDIVRVRSANHTSTCNASLWPALARIRSDEPVAMSELLDAVPVSAHQQLQVMLGALVMKGVITSL